MAEAILKHKLSDLEKQKDTIYGWTIDSAAIADWNVGYTSEDRCIAVLQENNMNTNHIARQVSSYMLLFMRKTNTVLSFFSRFARTISTDLIIFLVWITAM